jgi:hypothetical protein
MRWIGLLVGVCVLILGESASASAQIKEGDLRLFLDGSLVSWTKQTTEVDTFFGSNSSDSKLLATGIFTGGGAGVGYAVTRYLVPQLYMSLQNTRIKDSGGATLRQWDLRPCLEVPILPDERVVPYALAGLTLGRLRVKDNGDDIKLFGLGPVAGVGVHAFLTPRASLDASFTFQGTFFVKDDSEGSKTKQYALLLNLGASFWL